MRRRTLCQEVMLTGALAPAAILVDATHVYWNQERTGAISRVAKSGGSPEVVYDPGDAGAVMKRFDLFGGHVYFSTQGAIVRCPVSGCKAPPEVIIGNLTAPSFVRIEGTTLTYAEGYGGGRIGRCQLPTCTPELVAGAEANWPLFVAAGATEDVIAWAALLNQSGLRIKVGPTITAYWPGVPVRDLAIIGDRVLATRLDNGPTTVLLDGGDLRYLSTNPVQNSTYIALTDAGVLFTNSKVAGAVLECPLTGCTDASVIAANQPTPIGVAFDDKAIYWTNTGDPTGSVKKIAR